MIDTYKKHRPCHKCRTLGVTTSFCERKDGPHPLLPAPCWVLSHYAPHMHRNCINCGHVFFERPADSDDELYAESAIESRIVAHRGRVEEMRDLRRAIFPQIIVEGVGAGRSWWKP
jgi:hypothetical protein